MALLKKADAFRLTEDHLQVENQIIVKKNGQIDKDRLYSGDPGGYQEVSGADALAR